MKLVLFSAVAQFFLLSVTGENGARQLWQKTSKKGKGHKVQVKKCNDYYIRTNAISTVFDLKVGGTLASTIIFRDQIQDIEAVQGLYTCIINQLVATSLLMSCTNVVTYKDDSVLIFTGTELITYGVPGFPYGQSNVTLAVTGGTGTFIGASGHSSSSCVMPAQDDPNPFGCEYNGTICRSEEGLALL